MIDYYSAPPELDGTPVFSLDVRPALDNWGSIRERLHALSDDLSNTWKESRPPSNTPSDRKE